MTQKTIKTDHDHSPAPWRFDEYGALRDANGDVVRVEWTYASDPIGKTNARLIMVAPKLLKAVKRALVELIRQHEKSGCGHACPENFPCTCDRLIPELESVVSEIEAEQKPKGV
jgi:hypothetical protein